MKKIFIFALAAAAMASCTNDDFLGEGQGQALEEGQNGAILFTTAGGQKTQKGTKRKANHVGADAAGLLGGNFVVEGWKTATTATSVWDNAKSSIVFDNYNVNWTQNTAGKTESNTSDWEYVNVTKNGLSAVSEQTIKYWDHSTQQYDFYAYSLGKVDGTKATATQETPGTAMGTTTATSEQVTQNARAFATSKGGAYTLSGTAAQLQEAYISDLVTVPNANYNQEVVLSFRNLAAKVRVALYEKIPGYSVKDVEFYASGDATSVVEGNKVTLYTATANGIFTNGTYTIFFPTVDSEEPTSDKNKAHVAFAANGDQKTTVDINAALSYNNAKNITGTSVNYLGENSNEATYTAADKANAFVKVLPNESASALTLRVNYTLVSNDGSKETIKVWGAKAVVPAEYCQWKSNYAYTYIFKISDNTNGSTEALGGAVEGLHPITFDAVVIDSEEEQQETVTTVATPSITTYSPGVQPTANNEYKQNSWIYIMVMDGGTTKKLNTPANPCAIFKMNNDATEAEVMDALNMGTESAGTITGRNGIILTPNAVDATITTIPGVDGNNISIAAGDAALFQAAETGSYAVVYGVSAGTPTTYNSAITPANGASVAGLYEDFECTTPATGTANGTTVYYQKLTNNNNIFAIKVIKVVA